VAFSTQLAFNTRAGDLTKEIRARPEFTDRKWRNSPGPFIVNRTITIQRPDVCAFDYRTQYNQGSAPSLEGL